MGERSFRRLIRWRWVVVALAVVGLAIGHVVAPRLQVYRASTTILVGAPIDAPFQQVDDIDASEQLARVFVDLIPQERVLDPIIEQLALNTTWRQLRARIDIAVEGRSERLISVTATAGSPAEAEAIVAAIPKQLQGVAFGPGGSPDPAHARGFIWSRIDAMRRHIVRAERAASAPHAGPDTRALVARWNQALASMYRNLAREGSANHVEVIEPATVAGPVPAQPWIDVVAAHGGVLIAVLLACAVEFGGPRLRRGRVAPRAYA